MIGRLTSYPPEVSQCIEPANYKEQEQEHGGADEDRTPDPVGEVFHLPGERFRVFRVGETDAALRATCVAGRHPVSAFMTLDFIPLRRVACRAKALHVLDRRGAAEVEREDVVVVDELSNHPAVPALLFVASVNGTLNVLGEISTRFPTLRLGHDIRKN